jgi:hypothetical protein
MKKNSIFQCLVSLVLTALAVLTGGGAMAVTVGAEGTEPTDAGNPNTEPANPEVNDRESPGGKHDGQDLTGTQASSTQMREGGLEEEERDKDITQFFPFKTPLLSIIRKITKVVNISNWSVNHLRVGGETLDGVVTVNIAAGDTIKLTKNNFSGSLRPFYKNSTVFAPSLPGYKEGSTSEVEGHLMLEVVESDKTGVVLQAINGPAAVAGEKGTEYDSVTTPAIPAGTVLLCGATAGSESQLMITPENFQPREKEVYVQKKLLNIIWTDDYEETKKKYPFGVADIKRDAIIKYNLRAERTYLFGVKRKRKRTNEDGTVEDVFYTEGLITQLTNYYGIGSTYKLTDLIALNKLQFTDFAENNRAFAFCGKNAIERLENVDPGENRKIEFTDHNEFDLTFRRFRDTFGTIDYIWDQTLDFADMSDYMIIMDLKGARRYLKTGKKEKTNDMSKGSGEIREAQRWIRYEADGVALRGFNSILVGPEDKMFAAQKSGIINWITSANVLPATPSKNQKVALTADYTMTVTSGSGESATTTEVTYEKGNVYIYNGSAWELYRGYDLAA